MSDLISRSALLEAMDERFKECKGAVIDSLAEGFLQMENLIKEQPTVEPVRGEWIYKGFDNEWECSHCHSQITLSDDRNAHPNFCPQCGCDMRKKVEL